MPLINVANVGQIGVIKDLSAHELPLEAWTEASDIRFLDGLAYQSFSSQAVYDPPSAKPQHVFPVLLAGTPYWIYLSATKAYAVTSTSGVATHTDLTHVTPLTGVSNKWSSTLLAGIPVINSGAIGTDIPAAWDLNLANNFVDLSNWPASTYCKSLRAYRNFLVALNITKSSANFPYMVKWSHPAIPGSLPSTWDETDATRDAGEVDLAEGYDTIVDGLQLRDSFVIYKQDSAWLMSFVGGVSIFSFRKLFGHGALGLNCVVEIDGMHFVVTRSDVILHDGNSAISVLDKSTRRFLFEDIDDDGTDKVFVVRNPYFNEVLVCYPSLGATVCDKALAWNYKDKTVSFRTLPDVNHASVGHINTNLSGQWDQDTQNWDDDNTSWAKGDLIPLTASVIMAGDTTKLWQLDGSGEPEGTAILERTGLSFDVPDKIKLIRSIRPRITGTTGTVIIKVGSMDTPYDTPVYTTMTHTIGSTISNDCLVAGRYIAIRFESGTAVQWRLDSFQIDLQVAGAW
jgi:hypothetical protein